MLRYMDQKQNAASKRRFVLREMLHKYLMDALFRAIVFSVLLSVDAASCRNACAGFYGWSRTILAPVYGRALFPRLKFCCLRARAESARLHARWRRPGRAICRLRRDPA